MTNRIRPTTFCSAHWLVAMKLLFTSVLLLGLLQASIHTQPLLLQGNIVRVSADDTVTLLDGRHTLYKIRLAGIDAPESAMPYGKHATLYLVALVMLQAGLVWHYKYYEKEQPVAQAQAYVRAEKLARTKKLALWQDSDASAPWDWRKSRLARPPQMGAVTMLGEFATSADTTQ